MSRPLRWRRIAVGYGLDGWPVSPAEYAKEGGMVDELCDLCGEAVPPDELTTCDGCGALYCEDCAHEHDENCRAAWGDIEDPAPAFCAGCHGEHGPPMCPLSPGDPWDAVCAEVPK